MNNVRVQVLSSLHQVLRLFSPTPFVHLLWHAPAQHADDNQDSEDHNFRKFGVNKNDGYFFDLTGRQDACDQDSEDHNNNDKKITVAVTMVASKVSSTTSELSMMLTDSHLLSVIIQSSLQLFKSNRR